MSERFNEGDYVRFKGDEVKYKVTFINRGDESITYDLMPVDSPREDDISFVPSRLLEPWPQEVKVGQVWRGHDFEKGFYRLFVTRVDGEQVAWVTNWALNVSYGKAAFIREYYTLILEAEE